MREVVIQLAAGCLLLGAAKAAYAEGKVFDFKDPKGVNAIGIRLDSLLEPIAGVASGISGEITFDAAAPDKMRGTLVLEAASVGMSNPAMTKVLHTEEWLDVAGHPTIEYAIRDVVGVAKTGENAWDLVVAGTLTLKGVTREKEVTISATYLPGKYEERNHKGSGDLLILRSSFAVDRTQHNIKPELPPVTVARDIRLDVGIVGAWQAAE
jgi:polyisoprenoid-binding protein YceI